MADDAASGNATPPEGADRDHAGFEDGKIPGTADRCIPSRYVEGLRSALDPAALQQHIARGFREALYMAGAAAKRALDDAEEQLLTALDGLGSTRKRGHTLRNYADVRKMREEAEASVERWSAMVDLVKRLTEEVDEHAGLFTEECAVAMAAVTDEVKKAPWDHPAIDPWQHVPSLNAKLLELARDTPATTISKASFKVAVLDPWTAERALALNRAEDERKKREAAAAAAAAAAADQQDAATDAASAASPKPASLSAASPSASPKTLKSLQPSNASFAGGKGNEAPTASPPGAASPAGSPRFDKSLEGAPPEVLPPPVPQLTAAERQANVEKVLKRALPPLKITCMAADDNANDASDAAHGSSGFQPSWDLVFIGAQDGSVLAISPARLKDPLADEVAAANAGARGGSRAGGDRRKGGAGGRGSGSALPITKKLPGAPGTAGKPGAKKGGGAGPGGAAGDVANTGPYADVPGVRVYSGHVYPVTSLLAFTHKETRMIASASLDKTVRVSNVLTRELAFVFADNRATVLSMAYHRQLQRLVASCGDGTVHLWEPRFGEETTMVGDRRLGAVSCLAVSSNQPPKPTSSPVTATGPMPSSPAHRAGGRDAAAAVPPRIIAGNRRGALYVLQPVMPDNALYQPNDVIVVGAAVGPSGYLPVELGLDEQSVCREGHSARITVIEAPHHPYVFSGDESGVVNLFDINRMARLRRFHGHVDAISSLAVTSDGFLITASHDATIIAWSWRDGAQLHRLSHHFHKITGLLLGVLPKARVDVAALIASSNNTMRGGHGGGDDRWPGSNAIALRYLPGVAECTMITAAFDGTIGIATAAYDMS